jgi:DNA-binding SARP family transcriptional activator
MAGTATGWAMTLLQFGLFGPLEVRRDGVALPAPSGKRRDALALMLLDPGYAVTRTRLTAELWGDRPPASAAANLRTYVSSLRLWFGRWAAAPGVDAVARSGRGWKLAPPPNVSIEVDVLVFEAALANGRRAVTLGDLPRAARYFQRALRTCRGLPLHDVPVGAVLGTRAAVLTAQWLSAVEEYADVLLASGRHEQARSVLHAFLGQHPGRERAWGQLMVACYRGRDLAGALRAYQCARSALIDGLGVEPSAELRAVHQAILQGQSRLIGLRTVSGTAGRAPNSFVRPY